MLKISLQLAGEHSTQAVQFLQVQAHKKKESKNAWKPQGQAEVSNWWGVYFCMCPYASCPKHEQNKCLEVPFEAFMHQLRAGFYLVTDAIHRPSFVAIAREARIASSNRSITKECVCTLFTVGTCIEQTHRTISIRSTITHAHAECH